MTALETFVKNSATNYLQSVVFVDDEIYAGQNPLEASPTQPNLTGGLKPQFTHETSGDATVLTGAEVVGNREQAVDSGENPAGANPAAQTEALAVTVPYHPRELMESFAKQGIVCALYEPRRGFKSDASSVLFRLCERADVVILDWDLYKDDGDGVSELLAELIKKSEAALPHHVRLCALYTNRPSLQPIMGMLLQKLEKRGCSVDVVQGKLQLIAGATRISIFGKPVTAGRPPDDNAYEVKESDLAEKIISEFASLHHGLMPAFALHGLASVRRNTKRLLDKFRTELDGAFLLHRALVLGDGDAFEELPELLSDEIRAVLEDTWPDTAPLDTITSAVSDGLLLNEPVRSWKTRSGGKPCNAKDVFREMLKGAQGMKAAREMCIEVKDPGEGAEIKPALLKDFESMLTAQNRSCMEHLAALFCNRTQYGENGHALRFGTIVRHKNNDADPWNFSICLMPICDSQRLDQPWKFPFWRLKENAKEAISAKRIGIVIVDPEEHAHCLAAGGKIREMLWIQEFAPGASRSVTATQVDDRFRFATESMIVEWVAELKHLHAQRIAAYMGTEVSRVGLVESEWLRLYCDR